LRVDQDEIEKKKAAAIEFGSKHASNSVQKLKRDLSSKSSENVSLKRFVLGCALASRIALHFLTLGTDQMINLLLESKALKPS
jgi:hypothetical protein